MKRRCRVTGWNLPSSAFCKAGFVDRLGNFSSMILLNMFSVPLSWYSSPSIPIIR
ncbi:hypothetical protein STEG23_019652, partial [Scotinomys teguina]